MNKLYSVHDHWTDINKKNDVDIESIDGVITGIKVNGEDYGGGITWESVYSGSINPEGEVSPFTAYISLTMTATDLIKVVYDGVEYVLPKQVFNEKIYYGAVPAFLPADIDFTNYPFLIQVSPEIIRVYTETAGVHTLTISEPASGGGESDFSIAKVNMVTRTEQGKPSGAIYNAVYITEDDDLNQGSITGKTPVWNLVLYKGRGTYGAEGIISVEGSASYDNEEETITITGDCTVTLYYRVA